MKKKRTRILILTITFLTLSNLFSGYINILTEGLFQSHLYQTNKAEFEFTTMPSKGRDTKMMERQFADFKETHPEYSNLKLFRTFKRNPLKFWNWYSYLTDNMYKYEYQRKMNPISGKGKFGI